MTTSIISGTKMSSIIFFLLFFVSVGIGRNEGFPFGDYDYDGFMNNPYSNDRYNGGSADLNSNPQVNNNYGGFSNANADAKVHGPGGYADSGVNAGTNDFGSYSDAKSSAGTGGRDHRGGNSRTDSDAHAYIDHLGNVNVNAHSHAKSGYGGSNSASTGAVAAINLFGQPVAGASAAGSHAGSDGLTNALSTATVTGGSNPRNNGYYNNPYYNDRQFIFNSRSGVDEDDAEKKAEPKVDNDKIVFPKS